MLFTGGTAYSYLSIIYSIHKGTFLLVIEQFSISGKSDVALLPSVWPYLTHVNIEIKF